MKIRRLSNLRICYILIYERQLKWLIYALALALVFTLRFSSCFFSWIDRLRSVLCCVSQDMRGLVWFITKKITSTFNHIRQLLETHERRGFVEQHNINFENELRFGFEVWIARFSTWSCQDQNDYNLSSICIWLRRLSTPSFSLLLYYTYIFCEHEISFDIISLQLRTGSKNTKFYVLKNQSYKWRKESSKTKTLTQV